MFTTGFKLFFGVSMLGLLGTILYGVSSSPGGDVDYLGFVDSTDWVGALSLGWKGGVGEHVGYFTLLFFTLAAAGLAIMLVAFRDADPRAQAELHGGKLPGAQRPVVPNYWPIVGAFGMGVTVVGLVTHKVIFWAGLLVLGLVMFEWMMSAWADRATGDPAANKELRSRIMGPIEVPVVGFLGVGALVLAFSRILLTVSHEWAVYIAMIASAVIFALTILFAQSDKINKSIVAGFVVIGAIGTLAAGVVSASIGERDFHHEEHHEGDHSEEKDGDHSDDMEGLGAGLGGAN